MKTNAPEKIYIDDTTGEFDDHWNMYPNNDSIEYTRTDAFIEKAISWLKEQDEMIGVSFPDDFLERFRNYMKGE